MRQGRQMRQVRQVRQVNKYIREIIQCAKNNPIKHKKLKSHKQ